MITRKFALLASLALLPLVTSTSLDAQSYIGVGGRYDQQIAAIQRNSTLPVTGSVAVPFGANNRRVFVRFQADTGRNVSGFDVQMRYRFLGEVVEAGLYTADANGRPDTQVASGQIFIGTNQQFFRASFRDSYRVTTGANYFLSFELPPGETLDLGVTSGGPSVNVTYFVTRNGTAQQARLLYRVNTDGFSPTITTDQPRINSSFQVRCSGVPPHEFAILLLSINPPGVATSLHRAGAPGSFQYFDSYSILGYAWGNSGRNRSVTVPVGNDPVLIGLPINMQWYVSTPGANALGAVTSNAALTHMQ